MDRQTKRFVYSSTMTSLFCYTIIPQWENVMKPERLSYQTLTFYYDFLASFSCVYVHMLSSYVCEHFQCFHRQVAIVQPISFILAVS